MKFVITVISILLFINCFGQISNDELIVSKFNRIEKNPLVISYKNNKKINNCLLLNPGELAGQKQTPTTFAIYDTITNEAERVVIENARRVKEE